MSIGAGIAIAGIWIGVGMAGLHDLYGAAILAIPAMTATFLVDTLESMGWASAGLFVFWCLFLR